ncbi:MAG: MFS transporter [Actinomycetota bacterium]
MIKRGFSLLFKRRDFGLLMATQFLGQAGDGIVQAALAKLIVFGGQEGFDVENARDPEELLRIVLYLFVPYTIISPFLGVVIDRWERRRLLVLCNGLRAVTIAVIGLVGTGAVGSLALFLAFMLTLASTRVLLATKAAAIPATLEGESLVEGNAVSQLGGAMFQLGGAAVALVAAKFLDTSPIVLVGAVVYMAGAVTASLIRRAGTTRAKETLPQAMKNVVARIIQGLREVARVPKAAASITTYFWLRLLWSFAIVSIGFIARDLLKDDDLQILVITGGAGALGAVLGFIMANRLTARFTTTAYLVIAASVLAGVATAVLGALTLKVSLALLTFCLGFGFFLGKISLDTMVQEALGDDFRGRAFSLYDISYNMAWVVAAGILKLFLTDDNQGILLAGMGIVFLVGTGLIAAWYRRAGLLNAASA